MKMRERFFIVLVFAALCNVEAYAADAANGLATTGYVKEAVAAGVANKANKATSLSGYGITDAYTKAQVDSALGGKLSTSGTAAKATADASGNNIVNTYATKTELNTGLEGKQATLTTGDTGNIKGTGSVTVTKDASTGVITINGVDTDTKYTLPAATATTRGGVMVDTALNANSTNPVQNKAVKAALDTKADKTAIPTVNNATLTIQKNGTSVGTFTANQAANATVNVTVPTKVSELSNDSNFATTSAVNLKQDKSNMVADATDEVAEADKTKKYPSYASMEGFVSGQIASMETAMEEKFGNQADTIDGLAGRVNTAEADITALETKVGNTAVSTQITNAIGGLDGNVTGTTGVVKTIGQTNGKITAARATIDNADITAGTIAKDRLASAVQTSLGKADTALQGVSGGSAVNGKVATAVVKNGTNVSVTMDYVKIPVGSATAPTSVAQIWVQ